MAAGWTRADLDKMTCAVPGCRAKHHHGPLVLHSRCHPKQPTIFAYWYGGLVELRCKLCNRHVLNVQVSPAVQLELDEVVLECGNPNCKEPPEQHSLKPKPGCHTRAGVWVTYANGTITLSCGKCQTPFNELAVAPAPPAEA